MFSMRDGLYLTCTESSLAMGNRVMGDVSGGLLRPTRLQGTEVADVSSSY